MYVLLGLHRRLSRSGSSSRMACGWRTAAIRRSRLSTRNSSPLPTLSPALRVPPCTAATRPFGATRMPENSLTDLRK